MVVDPELTWLLRPGRRRHPVRVEVAPTDTLGHVVQMLGIPLTEVGGLLLDERPAAPSEHCGVPVAPRTRSVLPRPRPQPTRTMPPRFLLDVHLGSLARRLRLLGVDTAYETDAEDRELVRRAVAEERVLLSRDRGLLMRTSLPEGALVRGDRTDDQLLDVLQRFVPPLAPWTRCIRCNTLLQAVPMAEVADELEHGTRRSYRDFSRCPRCQRVYWRGAHSAPLEAIVAAAEAVVSGRSLPQEDARAVSRPVGSAPASPPDAGTTGSPGPSRRPGPRPPTRR